DGEQLDPKTQFRQLYDQEFHSVFRSIRAVVLDSAAAEDLTQETFVRAYRARTRYTPTAPPGAWLRRIGINLAISYLRRQKLARFLPARLYMAPDRRDYDRAEARDVVEKALTALSPKLRAAVVLHYYEGLTREEIAVVLGVPAGTVAVGRLHDCKRSTGRDPRDCLFGGFLAADRRPGATDRQPHAPLAQELDLVVAATPARGGNHHRGRGQVPQGKAVRLEQGYP